MRETNGEPDASVTQRVKKKRKTWEEKLAQLAPQEQALKEKLERLEAEKGDAFLMFRKVRESACACASVSM